MRRYVITMLVVAFLIGSLFKAADETGVRLMKMFGTLGILLFGVVGTLALTRWQSREGLKTLEAALKSLEPEHLITDWAFRGEGRPDYLVVGPAGLFAVCLEDVSQSVGAKRATARIAKGRERTLKATEWLRSHLTEASSVPDQAQGTICTEIAVKPVLVLLRRRLVSECVADGVTVVNAEQLAESIGGAHEQQMLDEAARRKITRWFRQT